MKRVKILLLFVAVATCYYTKAQNGFIYTHLKHISEENSPTASTQPDYSFVLKNSSGTVVSSFSLNDQATADNMPNSGKFLSAYDIGLSHGTGGDGQLWAVAGTGLGMSEANQYNTSSSSINNATGNIYYRNAGSTVWNLATNGTTTITGAKYIDGAYANQCVYSTANGVFFYYNGAVTQISTSTSVSDVTANGGRIAISSGSQVYVYSNTYSATAAPATGGNWISLSATTVTTGSRIDMNLSATTIVVENASSNTVKTIGFTVTSSTAATSSSTTLTSPGNGAANYWDIAYDDAGIIYTVANNSSTASDQLYSYNGSAWTLEAQGRILDVLTGGAAHLVYGVNVEGAENYTTNYHPIDCNSIFSRQTDQSGNIYWIDDERIKNSSSLNGNGFVISVSPGTYTLTETLPNNSTYDLGRYNIYDPGGSTTGNVNTQVVTYVVTANNIAFAEYVNEDLVPKAISLTCVFQYLQTFDASNSSPIKTYTYGNGTYGTNIEGTSYHYWGSSDAQDGYYMVVANTSNWWNNTGLTDHTGNNGYFLLVNASYAQDEFYRQRVTNLVPGVSYTIAFWAADMSPSNPLHPSITYGLQDSLGNVVNSTSTGTFSTSTWTQFSFTFTATTSRADLFLKNNNIGGNGNDVGIDDISINPVYPVLATNTTSPATTNICIGSNYTFSNSTSGGVWTSSSTAVATINAKSGLTAGHSAGTAIITYTYTNPIGCSATSPTTITVSAPPVVTATDKMGGAICLNQTDSLYTNFTTTSTSPYTYAWTVSPSSGGGLGTANIQNTSATPTVGGTYTFTTTVTDSVGCSASGSVNITVASVAGPTVTATATVTSLACTYPVYVTLNGSLSGTLNPQYSYVWSGPSTIYNASSGKTSATSYNNAYATTSTAGQYTLTVTDGNGCVASATTSTSVSAPISVTASSYAATECNNTSDSVFAVATGGTGALTYSWAAVLSTGVTYSPSAATNAREKVSFTTAGSYTFTATVKDTKGCTGTGSTTVKYLNTPGPTVSGLNAAATICLGSTINLSGTVADKLSGTQIGVASNVLEPISNAFDGSTSSYYEYFGTGGWVGLDLGSAQQITSLNYYPAQFYESYMVGGMFQGSNVANFASGVTTLYTITSAPSDAYQTVTITNTTAFRYVRYIGPSSGTYSSFCFIAELNFFGSVGYVWSGSPASNGLGATTTIPTTAVPTAAGAYTYTLTATDGNGCVAAASTGTQTVSPVPAVTATGANPAFCSTSGTDQLYAIATGGSGTYSSYAWSSAVVSGSGTTSLSSTSIYNPVATISGASTGNSFKYTVVVTDNNGCTTTASTSAVIVASSPSIIAVTGTSSSLCASNTATIALTGNFSGGTGPYNYVWTPPTNSTVTPSSGTVTASPVSATATATVAQTYVYGLTIVDANNCVASGSDTSSPITLNATLTVTASASTAGPICANPGTPINLTSSASGGSGSYTYAWIGSGTINTATSQNPTATPTATGTYTVTANDGAGCTGTATTATVTVDQASPSISYTCGTNSSGTNYLQFNETNGTSWLWTTTSGGRFYPDNTLSANNDATTSTLQAPYIDYNGTYNVQITDAAGCIGSGSITVTSSTCTTILAISNLNFAVQKQGNEALLSWSTLSEANNNHFDVERSGDGTNWAVIGTVKAVGNSSTLTDYSFVDAMPLTGDNYYRLAEVDDNGNIGYSPVKMIAFAGVRVIKMYPNPALSYVVLEFNNTQDEKAAITIQNMLGKTVLTQAAQLVNGTNLITLNQLQNLAQGTYIVTIATDNNVSRLKLVKGSN